MRNFDATGSDVAALHCYHCGRVIADGNWFARVKLGNRRVAMCCPRCFESFLDHPERCAGVNLASGGGGEPEVAAADPWPAAQVAPVNWERSDGSRPLTTAAMRFVDS